MNYKYYKKYLKYKNKYLNLMNKQFEGGAEEKVEELRGLEQADKMKLSLEERQEAIDNCCKTLNAKKYPNEERPCGKIPEDINSARLPRGQICRVEGLNYQMWHEPQ